MDGMGLVDHVLKTVMTTRACVPCGANIEETDETPSALKRQISFKILNHCSHCSHCSR